MKSKTRLRLLVYIPLTIYTSASKSGNVRVPIILNFLINPESIQTIYKYVSCRPSISNNNNNNNNNNEELDTTSLLLSRLRACVILISSTVASLQPCLHGPSRQPARLPRQSLDLHLSCTCLDRSISRWTSMGQSMLQGSSKTETAAGTRDGWRDGNECVVKMRKIVKIE